MGGRCLFAYWQGPFLQARIRHCQPIVRFGYPQLPQYPLALRSLTMACSYLYRKRRLCHRGTVAQCLRCARQPAAIALRPVHGHLCRHINETTKIHRGHPLFKGAVSGARKKQRKLRYAFILAQVYEETGQIAEAQEAYRAVRKMRPPYEMAFNANINRVSIVVPGMPTDDTKRAISKLLRDKRNLLYQDRIYFALANVNQIDGDTNEALANLKTSTKVSVNNDKQKAISFMRMGDIYYDMPRYKFAYQAYDSAMVYMPETDEEFTRVKDKHASLQQLVVHIDTRERQDSLQNLAIMSQDRRLAAIDKIIFDAAKKQEEEMARQEEMQYGGNVNDFYGQSLSSQQTGGKWYFYNLASIGMGKSEFERKWGRRKLEDNWRRANKMAVLQIEEAGPGEPPGLPDKDPMAKAIEGDPNAQLLTMRLNNLGKYQRAKICSKTFR
jgi:tetratricopeptide (TPR) repeat protein